MVSKFALLSNLFLGFVALALLPSKLGARLARGEGIQSRLSDRSASSVDGPVDPYNDRWAGSQCTTASFSEKFNYIFGTFIVPALDPDQQLEGFSGVRIAVVLGGITCSSVFLGGVRITFSENGVASYQAMYGTHLDDFQDFTAVGEIKPGDQIKLTAYVSNEIGQGMVVVENISPSTGRLPWASREPVKAPEGNPPCNSAAQWIVHAYKNKGEYVPLANFRKVIFTDGVAEKFDYITENVYNCALAGDDVARTDIARDSNHIILTETMLEGTAVVTTWVNGG